jgi:hypothetical protein
MATDARPAQDIQAILAYGSGIGLEGLEGQDGQEGKKLCCSRPACPAHPALPAHRYPFTYFCGFSSNCFLQLTAQK